MFKIRLLTLSLISLIFLSCTKNNFNQNKTNYSIGYIGGEFDGLVLKTKLKNTLNNMGLYKSNSNFNIDANISHSSSLFITNIDNTSDRMRLISKLNIKVTDKFKNCDIYSFEESISQFYIFADSNKYISNSSAEKKIKEQNTEMLVKDFINKIRSSENKCI